MITALAAAKAYAAAQKAQGMGEPMPSLSGSSAPQQGGFGDLVKSAISDAVGASKHAEHQMAAQVAGKAELVDVVTAITVSRLDSAAEMAVRDQVISAYQEIMRMPI